MSKQRMYMLVSIHNKTGVASALQDATPMTTKPFTHAECMTMKSKLTEYPFRTITVIEA